MNGFYHQLKIRERPHWLNPLRWPMRINTGDDEQPEIGLIALIDCIFFLLMFFMVATSFKQKEQQHKDKPLPIQLPRSGASLVRAEAAPDPLVIRIDRAGTILVQDAALSTEALHA